jgi:tRNA(Ile)-lysidine synthase
LGFSGGTDSLCLLSLLVETGWQVIAAHFDHNLRPESPADAARARELAAKLGAKFILGAGDVRQWAQERKISIEAAARELRYSFLFKTAQEAEAQAVCTAHTADDQAETVLMHLLRGSGLAGLSGMQTCSIQPGWSKTTPLVRPLLAATRAETADWCKAHGLAPVDDPSNFDRFFLRNRLRHELLPLLETYNPNVRATLARTAHVLGAQMAVINAAADEDWHMLRRGSGPGWVGLDAAGLGRLSEGRLLGVLRLAAGFLRPAVQDLDFEDFRRAAEFAHRPTRSKETDLACGLWVRIEAGCFYLHETGSLPPQQDWPQFEDHVEKILPVPGELILANGWGIHTQIVPREMVGFKPEGEWEAWLDADRVSVALTLRVAREGESIRPVGMGGKTQKLSDVWVNARVSRRARRLYPLVCSGDQVVWAPGVRRSELFLLDGVTKRVIRLRLFNPSSRQPVGAA